MIDDATIKAAPDAAAMERKYVAVTRDADPRFGVKLADDGYGTLDGYASPFGQLDSSGDIVAPGAYTKTTPQFLANGFLAPEHEWGIKKDLGLFTAAAEDAYGLRIAAGFHPTGDAQDVRVKCANRLDNGKTVKLSIGYTATKFRMLTGEQAVAHLINPSPDDIAACKARGRVRLLEEIHLWEVSIVSVPAATGAGVVAVKAGATPDATANAAAKAAGEMSAYDLARMCRACCALCAWCCTTCAEMHGEDPLAAKCRSLAAICTAMWAVCEEMMWTCAWEDDPDILALCIAACSDCCRRCAECCAQCAEIAPTEALAATCTDCSAVCADCTAMCDGYASATSDAMEMASARVDAAMKRYADHLPAADDTHTPIGVKMSAGARLTMADHFAAVLSATATFTDRYKALAAIRRETKAGRAMSQHNRDRYKAQIDGLDAAITTAKDIHGDMIAFYSETDPEAETITEAVAVNVSDGKSADTATIDTAVVDTAITTDPTETENEPVSPDDAATIDAGASTDDPAATFDVDALIAAEVTRFERLRFESLY